jgi:hypothetical protein
MKFCVKIKNMLKSNCNKMYCVVMWCLWPVGGIAIALVAELVKGKAAVHQNTCINTQ